MNNFPVYIILVCLLVSCQTKSHEGNLPSSKEKFTINGKCKSESNQMLYLYISDDTTLNLLDSVRVLDQFFQIEGSVPHPYKAFIQFQDQSTAFPFILTNESIEIELDTSNLSESTIANSEINKDLASVKRVSSEIYQKIDYLFPQLQKARMENDFVSLNKINQEIDNIELENLNFLYNYIEKNPKKELSGLLLNDLWKKTERDSIQLQNLARNLSPEIKNNVYFSIH